MQTYQTCSDEELDHIERKQESRRHKHLEENINGGYLGIVATNLQIDVDEIFRKIILPTAKEIGKVIGDFQTR
jgi:hypothetical protein